MAADRLVVPQPRDDTAQLTPAETAADGLAIETHVLARLLGIKLLTLEGLVLVSPAAVRRDGGRSVSSGTDHDPSTSSPSPTSSASSASSTQTRPSRPAAPTNGGAPGSGLAGATRLLAECAEELRVLDADRVAKP